MIVVVGSPAARVLGSKVSAAGLAATIALAAAAAGRRVELVGKAGDDPIDDAVVLDLASHGVGHVALLRVPAGPTVLEPDPVDDDIDPDDAPTAEQRPTRSPLGIDAGDVDLGLRYLTDFSVVVAVAVTDPVILGVAIERASWAGARLVIVVGQGDPAPTGVPPEAIVFEAPDADPDGAFGTLVGAFAAGLDAGDAPGDAFRSSIATDGWTRAADD